MCGIELGTSSNAFPIAFNIFVASAGVTTRPPATISPSRRPPAAWDGHAPASGLGGPFRPPLQVFT
ncbi:hypothetical protein MB84_28350 (plasmid) [Pandoraea oxalativorans]|uniref:Uncharacterized protein n=1 Tax=Pandoraea oxalativorans TaxID=573737 RepID=A0A0G3IHR4_9BURK|nr:hypothetical protein MB84_28350 [Pandoraea oxalativorans]